MPFVSWGSFVIVYVSSFYACRCVIYFWYRSILHVFIYVYRAAVLLKLYPTEFNVCGSVHLGNICFIPIQLDVQYSFFLKSFLLYMFRMSYASIVRSTTVVYSHRFFFVVLVCLFHGAGTGVGTLWHFSTVSFSLKLTVTWILREHSVHTSQ
jgi:hypothetical protein